MVEEKGSDGDARDAEDELSNILKALETVPPEKGGIGNKVILGSVIAVVLISLTVILVLVNRKVIVPDFTDHTVADAEQMAEDILFTGTSML